MAIKTGEIFNSLVFGGVNSADYGIYITGEGVFNAPKRAVNMVAVPGRNGSIAIDQGHWENIEVTYPARYVRHGRARVPNGAVQFQKRHSVSGRISETYGHVSS